MDRPPRSDFRRAICYSSPVASFSKWPSRCGGWAIVRVSSTLGLGTRYLVIKRGVFPDHSGRHWECVASRHRRLAAAVRAWRKASKH